MVNIPYNAGPRMARSQYTGPHNPAAYQRAIERRIARNREIGRQRRAAERLAAWTQDDPSRVGLIEQLKERAERRPDSFLGKLYYDGILQYGSLTPKQEEAAHKALTPAPVQAADRPGSTQLASAEMFNSMISLFDTAAERLKFPAIVFGVEGGRELRVYRAGANSSAPGALTVQYEDDRTYLGRIHTNGVWAPTRVAREDTSVMTALQLFSRDPAGAASAYGKRTGRCCFCKKRLTDARSTAVGYGETCAGHYNLPWGE
jgi:hypothetical protein